MNPWRAEKPDTVGWWLYAFPSPHGWCIESSYWDDEYLAMEQAEPRYENPKHMWLGPLALPTAGGRPTDVAANSPIKVDLREDGVLWLKFYK